MKHLYVQHYNCFFFFGISKEVLVIRLQEVE